MISRATSREVIHPGGEIPLITVGVPVFQHALEDDLGDVLGGGPVAGIFREKPKQRPVMFFEKFSKRIDVAIAYGEHQFVVRLKGSLFQVESTLGVSRGQFGGDREI